MSIDSNVLSEIPSILLDEYTFMTTWNARFQLEFQNPWSSGPECVDLKSDNKWVWVAYHYLSQLIRGSGESGVSVYFNNASSLEDSRLFMKTCSTLPIHQLFV